MITVCIKNDDKIVENFEIMLLGGGNQGVGGPTGYDYVLMKPRHFDMPPIAHKPEDGDLLLVTKILYTYTKVLAASPNNIIQFPTKQ